MILVWLILGLFLPTLSGWLLVRTLEANVPVLFRLERWVFGFLFGLTGFAFLAFLTNTLIGLPFTRLGLFGLQAVTTAALGGLWFYQKRSGRLGGSDPIPRKSAWPRKPVIALIVILGLWTTVKILGGVMMLTNTPIYFDDGIDNWNFRGKLYYTDHTLTLNVPPTDTSGLGGLSSYPPTVPLAKTWLANVAGFWDEGLVDSIHALWFFAALALLYFALRRSLSWPWALIGTYALSSLPLYLIQGTNTYADVFLSAHIFATVSLLLHSFEAKEESVRRSFLRLAGLAATLLVFTKNEAIAVYLPGMGLFFAIGLLVQWKRGMISLNTAAKRFAYWCLTILIVAAPWILFKWAHGLTFGNGKSIGNLSLGWQPGVINAILVNTFFEGNWIFLFPAAIALIAFCWRKSFGSALAFVSGFIMLVIGFQLLIFMFTGLSTEALYQTGLARGFIQVVPLIVFLSMRLLAGIFQET